MLAFRFCSLELSSVGERSGRKFCKDHLWVDHLGRLGAPRIDLPPKGERVWTQACTILTRDALEKDNFEQDKSK